nr:hypothetical protein CFP56_19200 [Quercus suber]
MASIRTATTCPLSLCLLGDMTDRRAAQVFIALGFTGKDRPAFHNGQAWPSSTCIAITAALYQQGKEICETWPSMNRSFHVCRGQPASTLQMRLHRARL